MAIWYRSPKRHLGSTSALFAPRFLHPRLGMAPSISHHGCSCAVVLKETLPLPSCQARDFPLSAV